MAKRGSRAGGRRRSRSANSVAPPPSSFGNPWLQRWSETGGRYIDLTKYEDRRRWSPESPQWPRSYLPPRGLSTRPRIVIVGENDPLAYRSTYGGRYPLSDVLRNRVKSSKRYGKTNTWVKERQRGPHGVHDVLRRDELPYRIGFTLPWQVIICVRRKRRREVLHALRFTGKGATRLMRKRKNKFYSEVRC